MSDDRAGDEAPPEWVTFDRYTGRIPKVIELAGGEARRRAHPAFTPLHLLLGLILEREGIGTTILEKLGVDLHEARRRVEAMLPPRGDHPEGELIGWGARVPGVFERALAESRAIGHEYVGTEHLLLGLLCESSGACMEAFAPWRLDVMAVRREMGLLLGVGRPRP